MRYWKAVALPHRPLLSVVVATYLHGPDADQRCQSLRCLLTAFEAQTYPEWQAVVVHDGPDRGCLARHVLDPLDDCVRVKLVVTPERKGDFGHHWRKLGVAASAGAYVGFANDDGYYAPVYFEALARKFVLEGCDFAHCNMIHSHKLWQPFPTQPRKGKLDVGAWMARRDLVEPTPWTDFSFAGDGTFINAVVAKARKIGKIKEYLFVHN